MTVCCALCCCGQAADHPFLEFLREDATLDEDQVAAAAADGVAGVAAAAVARPATQSRRLPQERQPRPRQESCDNPAAADQSHISASVATKAEVAADASSAQAPEVVEAEGEDEVPSDICDALALPAQIQSTEVDDKDNVWLVESGARSRILGKVAWVMSRSVTAENSGSLRARCSLHPRCICMVPMGSEGDRVGRAVEAWLLAGLRCASEVEHVALKADLFSQLGRPPPAGRRQTGQASQGNAQRSAALFCVCLFVHSIVWLSKCREPFRKTEDR